jgi:hypothetical protein
MAKRRKKSRSPAVAARTLYNKQLAAWSKLVKDRDHHRCIMCGKMDKLNSHHILPKKIYPWLSLLLECGVTLCAGCHKFRGRSAEQNGFWFAHWLREHRPDQYQWAVENMGDTE